jgi:hypothetical protein
MMALVRVSIASVLMLLSLVLLSSCRDGPLCVRTVRSTCICDDPRIPDIRSCVAYLDVSSCTDPDGGIDVCQIQPCCRLASDGGVSDAGTDGPPGSPIDSSTATD